jgi:hypothetical protein
VRAAAGVTFVMAAFAFSLAQLDHYFLLLQATSSFFLLEFLIRTTVGLRYSPVGIVAQWMTRWQPAEWVSVKPKLFAWRLGLAIALAMTVITNSGIRGWLPKSFCIVCLTLMWMESSLGLCLGCKIHAVLVQRGWIDKDPGMICAHGVCQVPRRAPQEA